MEMVPADDPGRRIRHQGNDRLPITTSCASCTTTPLGSSRSPLGSHDVMTYDMSFTNAPASDLSDTLAELLIKARPRGGEKRGGDGG